MGLWEGKPDDGKKEGSKDTEGLDDDFLVGNPEGSKDFEGMDDGLVDGGGEGVDDGLRPFATQ